MVCAGAAVHAGEAADPRNSVRSIAAIAIATGADAVRVDGDLTDPIWSKAPAVTEFLQRDPTEGAAPTHPTEVRVALELHCRGDQPASAATLVSGIESRIASLPPTQAAFTIVTTQFLRARAEQRGESTRAILVEYRFRLLSN